MKKILQTVMMAILMIYFSTGISLAAQLEDHVETASVDGVAGFSKSSSRKKSRAEYKVKKNSLKIAKAMDRSGDFFRKSYGGITNAEWTLQKRLIVASFTNDSARTYVVYNRGGGWVHTMSHMFPAFAPEGIKRQALYNFPNHDLTFIVKANTRTEDFYVLSLENRISHMEVILFKDEFRILKEFSKR